MERNQGTDRKKGITKQQIRMIWALCHRLGMDEQTLHGLAQTVTGVSSIRQLSRPQAARLIEMLLTKAGFKTQTFPRRPGLNTPHQLAYIEGLTTQLGWRERQTRGLARRMYRVRRLKDLGVRQASGLIEALKAIRLRKTG